MNRSWPDKTRRQVFALYKKRNTYKQISEVTGVPTTTISTWVREERKRDKTLPKAVYRECA